MKQGRSSESAAVAAPPAPAAPARPAQSADVALICGPTSDGQGVNVLRCRDGVVSAGAVRPLTPGKPIHGEVVRLTPRPEQPRLCDVEVEYAPEASGEGGARKGPVQVATDDYRRNWDAIYGKNAAKPELSN